jgi:hypothetical protein
MVEDKTQLLWLETTTKNKTRLGRNRGIPKTQLGFSLDQNYSGESLPSKKIVISSKMRKFYWTNQKYNSSFKEHTVANSAPHPPSPYPTLPIPVNTTQCGVRVPIPSRDPAHQHHLMVTKSELSSQCSGNTNQLCDNCSSAKNNVK